MSSAQPSASDRKFVPVAYGLPCADCGTYYPSQMPKCPTCGSAKRGPFTSSGKHARPRTAQIATPGNPPITGATERLFSRLAYGLPCAKCGCYYGGDLKECPTCHSSQRGARIFGPQAVKAPVSAAILATTSSSDRVRGLGLPCADCGAYYSGDVSACLNCGSRKRGPLASGKRLGPTLVTSAKTVAAAPAPAASPRPAARTVKTGLPCAKCHSYYDADRETCPSCGHRERRRIATLPPVEVAAAPVADETQPDAVPVAPPSLLSERAASLASEIAELLAQKLHEPDLREAIASSDKPEEQIQEFHLAPTGPVALPQLVAETAEVLLSIPAAEPAVELPPEVTNAMQPVLAPAESTAPVILEIPTVAVTPAAEVAPEVPPIRAEQTPVFAFDLAAFAPAASPQHFVVETEPSILDDPDSLAAAISQAVDKAMRAVSILPMIEPTPAELPPQLATSSAPEEFFVADVERAAPASSSLYFPAVPADATSREVTLTPETSAAAVESIAPELLPMESVAPLEAEGASCSESPVAALAAEAAAVDPAPPMPPTPAATEYPEAVLMLSIPESAWLDCPAGHASYDAALETCPTCAAASSPEVSEVPITTDTSTDSEVAASAHPEIDLDVVRCAVCDSAYLATLAACPACLQASQSVELMAAPVSETAGALSAISLVPPAAAAPTPIPVDDESMTLIDALDFFEELTRKLRA